VLTWRLEQQAADSLQLLRGPHKALPANIQALAAVVAREGRQLCRHCTTGAPARLCSSQASLPCFVQTPAHWSGPGQSLAHCRVPAPPSATTVTGM